MCDVACSDDRKGKQLALRLLRQVAPVLSPIDELLQVAHPEDHALRGVQAVVGDQTEVAALVPRVDEVLDGHPLLRLRPDVGVVDVLGAANLGAVAGQAVHEVAGS